LSAELAKYELLQTVFFDDFAHWVNSPQLDDIFHVVENFGSRHGISDHE